MVASHTLRSVSRALVIHSALSLKPSHIIKLLNCDYHSIVCGAIKYFNLCYYGDVYRQTLIFHHLMCGIMDITFVLLVVIKVFHCSWAMSTSTWQNLLGRVPLVGATYYRATTKRNENQITP